MTKQSIIAQEMERMGLGEVQEYYYNLDRSETITHGILNGEGELSHEGAFVVNSSPHLPVVHLTTNTLYKAMILTFGLLPEPSQLMKPSTKY